MSQASHFKRWDLDWDSAITNDDWDGWFHKCENMTSSGENAQLCYCDTKVGGALCNDITKCVCNPGDSYTPYANVATNKRWAEWAEWAYGGTENSTPQQGAEAENLTPQQGAEAENSNPQQGAETKNSTPHQVFANAFATVLSAVSAFRLL